MLNQRDKDTLGNAVTPVKPRKRASEPKTAPVAKVAKTSTAARPTKAKARQAPVIAHQDIAYGDIARLAYHLWESRGYSGGSPDEDWYSAEALLRQRTTTIS